MTRCASGISRIPARNPRFAEYRLTSGSEPGGEGLAILLRLHGFYPGEQGRHTRPLQPELSRIDAISSTSALRTEMAVLQQMGVGVAFKLLAGPDPKHSTQVIVHIRQGGLGMPDRDDYLRKDSTMVRTRREYIAMSPVHSCSCWTATGGRAVEGRAHHGA